ncbi:MAG: hypothetical protein ACRCTQ_04595 [Brevinemataceae bacterium]
MKKESYFLDIGLINLLNSIEFLSIITSKDLYHYIKSIYQENPYWSNEHFFTIQTFYTWLRQGKKDHRQKLQTKQAFLYKETHRLKNNLRQKEQSKACKKRIREINQTELFRMFYINAKINRLKSHYHN